MYTHAHHLQKMDCFFPSAWIIYTFIAIYKLQNFSLSLTGGILNDTFMGV